MTSAFGLCRAYKLGKGRCSYNATGLAIQDVHGRTLTAVECQPDWADEGAASTDIQVSRCICCLSISAAESLSMILECAEHGHLSWLRFSLSPSQIQALSDFVNSPLNAKLITQLPELAWMTKLTYASSTSMLCAACCHRSKYRFWPMQDSLCSYQIRFENEQRANLHVFLVYDKPKVFSAISDETGEECSLWRDAASWCPEGFLPDNPVYGWPLVRRCHCNRNCKVR